MNFTLFVFNYFTCQIVNALTEDRMKKTISALNKTVNRTHGENASGAKVGECYMVCKKSDLPESITKKYKDEEIRNWIARDWWTIKEDSREDEIKKEIWRAFENAAMEIE